MASLSDKAGEERGRMKGDTISRSALEKTLIKHYGEDDRSYDAAIALTAVQQAPTVAAAPEWIRVEDRLPEMLHAVLVYCPKYNNIFCAYIREDGHWYDFIQGNGGQIVDEVTRWMPLPEPPKDGGEGE